MGEHLYYHLSVDRLSVQNMDTTRAMRNKISGLEVRRWIRNRCEVIWERYFEWVEYVVSGLESCASLTFKHVSNYSTLKQRGKLAESQELKAKSQRITGVKSWKQEAEKKFWWRKRKAKSFIFLQLLAFCLFFLIFGGKKKPELESKPKAKEFWV